MKAYPIISVVIPTHSGSNVISRAVDSVLSQTYPNIEVVVVDDNGKGNEEQLATEKQMAKYQLDDRVKYVVHDISRHGSAARNTGVKNSKGVYIALLDDDDYFISNNIENHYNTLLSHDDSFGLSFCGMHIIHDGIEEDVMSQYEGEVLVDFLMGKIRVGSSLVMIKRSVYEEFNGFDESFKRHQDWEFLTRIFTKYKLACTREVGVVKINLNRNNAVNPNKFEDNRIYFLNKMSSIINSLPLTISKKIYDVHYGAIAKEYFRACKVIGVVKWSLKTSHPLACFMNIIKSAFVFLTKRYK